MASLFIAHSSHDSSLATRLNDDLTRLGHNVWVYEQRTRVGRSIPLKMQEALEGADYVVYMISRASRGSGFTDREWLATIWREMEDRRVRLLPALVDDTRIPGLLRDKAYADFRGSYVIGLRDLILALEAPAEEAGIRHVYGDIMDMYGDWEALFEHSRRLDLFLMYGRTWRNTYLKYIERLVGQRDGRVRVVLPDISPASKALALYAKLMRTSQKSLRGLIEEAYTEFAALRPKSRVQLYSTQALYRHALYLFDTGGVLALYALTGQRIPTPCFLVADGSVLDAIRTDFERLVNPRSGLTQRVT